MTAIEEKVAQLRQEGYSFKLGEYINLGWSIFKSSFGLFVAFGLILLVASSLGNLLPLANYAISFGVAVASTGFAIVGARIYNKQEHTFSHFFDGFQHFLQLFLVNIYQSLAILLLACITFIPLFLVVPEVREMLTNGDITLEGLNDFKFSAEDFSIPPAVTIGLIISLLLLIATVVLWIFAPMFVVFHNMTALNAMKASSKVVFKNWLLFIAFMFVLGLIMLLGILALIVGVFVAYPAIQVMVYAAFEKIVGTKLASSSTDISEHLVV